MYIIQDVLVSSELFERRFVCNLSACKGACCWEGDWGAPLESEELHILDAIFDALRPFLSPEGSALLENQGRYAWFEEPKDYGTPLLEDGRCAYLTLEGGVAKCGIEKAWEAGAVPFRKPVSCHLYPVRVRRNRKADFEALNFDEWDICSPACRLGAELQVPVFRFVREALVRKYGAEFYEELEAAYRQHLNGENDS
ncbi:MAG: DUF3109 family protein [Bacteroidetes bacterium]|nr:MAG: DUF3109 family protein [Bacteroidota bacterium]